MNVFALIVLPYKQTQYNHSSQKDKTIQLGKTSFRVNLEFQQDAKWILNTELAQNFASIHTL